MATFKDPRKPAPKDRGRYHGDTPTYRRNQIGDYSSDEDRYNKGRELVPALIDQNNPYLFPGAQSDDGYWRVFILTVDCREGCGGCPGESGKIFVYPGQKPLQVYFALGPSISIAAGSTHIQLHRWLDIPSSVTDIPAKRKWVSDLPFNGIARVQPGIYSVSAKNSAGNRWDTVCLSFGQIALGNLTLELSSF